MKSSRIPKSRILSRPPRSIIKLLGLMSRWTTSILWAEQAPAHSSSSHCNFCATGTAVRLRMSSVMVSPWMYSMTM